MKPNVNNQQLDFPMKTSQIIHVLTTPQTLSHISLWHCFESGLDRHYKNLELCAGQICLKLRFLLLLECLHRLEESKSTSLDCLDGLVLFVTLILILLLKAFHKR